MCATHFLQGDVEKLAIFGNQRARRGAQLKVMAAVETKVPGHFTNSRTDEEDTSEGFGTHTLVLKVLRLKRNHIHSPIIHL